MAKPKAIVPGLYHWTAVHPAIGVRVSSYYLVQERVLIDPLLPDPLLPDSDGLAWLRAHGPPQHILLTNRLHSRHSAKLVAAFGCAVWCNRAGLHNMAAALNARSFVPGDALPGGARAIKIGVLCPDESALLLPSVRAAAVADGVVRAGAGPLDFVPDGLLADDPGEVGKIKRGLKAAYRRLAREDFDHLLLAHGQPWLNDGRAALRAWAHEP
jgi:hypothetical protein